MKPLLFLNALMLCTALNAQTYTRADSLRGSLNENRSWWDVLHYNLHVKVNLESKSIKGSNVITYKPIVKGRLMQIDLQEPLRIDSVVYHQKPCKFKYLLNAWLVELPLNRENIRRDSICIYYSGKPKTAKLAPWEGGLIWGKDDLKRPWIGVSCQGLGASVWWPNKDHQSDEPEEGMKITLTIPDTLVNISNGQLIAVKKHPDRSSSWTYLVKNPINNYDATFNIGKYVTTTDTFKGKSGLLKIEYVVLDYNQEKVEPHLKKDTKDMLRAFEYWFGPYPFYEDGYRLVETSYLGMEHQSAIAYGNKFKKGYLGRDRSGTGTGMLWDFIIVHESGHEWFGNNITCKDVADLWIHEGFTTYAEALFLEYNYHKDSASRYVIGLRKNILNDRPLIGPYGVNKEGSFDIYDKGANLIHTIRQLFDNDSTFREVLLGLNKTFGKKTVNSKEIENYINSKSRIDLTPVFDQYLRTTAIPILEYELLNGILSFKWQNCFPDFSMPLRIFLNNKEPLWIYPEAEKKEIRLPANIKAVTFDKNFYIRTAQGFK
jgi:aminopeptidase N